jgi:hypothetical protein
MMVATLDDWLSCGGMSTTADISLIYTAAPDVLLLLPPSSSAIGVNLFCEFRLGSTDDSNNYLRYKIELCTTSNCSSIPVP